MDILITISILLNIITVWLLLEEKRIIKDAKEIDNKNIALMLENSYLKSKLEKTKYGENEKIEMPEIKKPFKFADKETNEFYTKHLINLNAYANPNRYNTCVEIKTKEVDYNEWLQDILKQKDNNS